MKILVIGAAGKTGEAVVSQALAQGHQVTALVHHAYEFTMPGVRVLEGDARDQNVVSAAVAGQDAVIDTIGGKTPYKQDSLEPDVAQAILNAMESHSVRRLLVISALGVGDSKANTSFVYDHILMPTFLRGVVREKAAMEAEVSASGLDWTIVRPALLTDDEPSGQVRTYAADDGNTAHKISREDLAHFLVDQVGRETFSRQAVTVASV